MSEVLASGRHYEIAPAHFTVADFVSWQRHGELNLHPPFQRRSVWKPEARSLFIDSLVRGVPVPLLFLHLRLDFGSGRSIRDVVDGQQRLRTVLAYVDPKLLPDYDPEQDVVVVKRAHNSAIAGRTFGELDRQHQTWILEYKFSVQVLPSDVSDPEILEIFARINSTGERLNHQELRNAAYFGEFKTTMYEIAYQHFERWLRWQVFTPTHLTRMREVELTSDLVVNMLNGVTGKSQARLNRTYAQFDDRFEGAPTVRERFDAVMATIDDLFGPSLRETIFVRDVHFFTLFVVLYELLYGLGSPLAEGPPRPVPKAFVPAAWEVSRRFREWEVPREVIDAVNRASSDVGRRRTRVKYMMSVVREYSPETVGG